jgi:ABC-2 type transport system permease protein
MNTFYITKKELKNYFFSSIAYVFFAFFLFIVGLFFFLSIIRYSQMSMYAQQSPQMMQHFDPVEVILSPLFGLMGFLFIFLIPVITMRLFAEERKLGTIELLFTYPVTELQMFLGKFLAAAVVLLIIFGISFTYIIIYRNYFAPISWGLVGSGYLGLFLLALSFLSFGIWISSFTSDQITSALATIGGVLIFWIIGSVKSVVPENFFYIGDFINQISMYEHFQNLSKGIIDTNDILYFLCFIIFFSFMSIQMLEVRKWKG